MNAPTAVYTVRDERGVTYPVFDTERAERLSRAGLTVSARTQ
ncbi:hypothetical protein HRTV-28_gp49 [Halorubrum tailed virus 28]|uniref:Uncharacterized protein n=1 Tax=Halorubrum tailed virus 28 TaxID=2878009 RepID=A0AAE8XZZ9_9CAUD|nr:hypothetical protein M1M39_gp50 [Halorubrum tailed virus 28]UBF23487.1 hypothetical protein HRTV-28_gp49 [Halorubrum tailed virus 28]